MVLRMDPQGRISGSFKSAMTDATGDGKFDPATQNVTLSIETEQAGLEVTGTITGTDMTGNVDIGGGAFSVTFTAKRTGDCASSGGSGGNTNAPAKPSGESLEKLLPAPRWVSFHRGVPIQAGMRVHDV